MASVNRYCLAKDKLCKVLSKPCHFKACAQPHNTLDNKTLSDLFPFYFKRSPPTVAGFYFGK